MFSYQLLLLLLLPWNPYRHQLLPLLLCRLRRGSPRLTPLSPLLLHLPQGRYARIRSALPALA